MDRFPSTWVLLQFYYTYVSGRRRSGLHTQQIKAQCDAGGTRGLTKMRVGRCGTGETPKAFPIL